MDPWRSARIGDADRHAMARERLPWPGETQCLTLAAEFSGKLVHTGRRPRAEFQSEALSGKGRGGCRHGRRFPTIAVKRPILMNTTSFDTLDAMRRLEQAGMDRAQAEATVETMRDAQTALATKADLFETRAALKADLSELRADLYRALWIQGAGIVAINSAFIATAAAVGLI